MEVAGLRARLEAIGIAVVAEKPSVTVVRGWRATLEERLAQTQATCERLSILAKEVAGLPRIRTELIAVQRQIAQKEQALKVVEERGSQWSWQCSGRTSD